MGKGSERNNPCPCGSGRKVKKCHGMTFEPGGEAAIAPLKPWAPLSLLVGQRMQVEKIVTRIGSFHQAEGLFKLCQIAADLSQGLSGPEVRAWSYDLLVQGVGSADPIENAIGRAVTHAGPDIGILHGHVVFLLQLLVLLYSTGGDARMPSGGALSFMALALNDYIPEWLEPSPTLSEHEQMLGMSLFESLFNHTSDDPLRFIVRAVEIFGGDVSGTPIGLSQWKQIQLEAFGCTFNEYAENFLIPIFVLSWLWSSKKRPVIDAPIWEKTELGHLYSRWFREASIAIDDAAKVWPVSLLPSGLPRIPAQYFRTPLVRVGEHLFCLSPWHWRDHVVFGTWGKLNLAAKKVIGTSSNQQFTSAIGYLFERWCRTVMSEAVKEAGFRGTVLMPTSPGSNDEIEDMVVVQGDRVVLFSAKSSLVPEASLKSAGSLKVGVSWLRRFFLEDALTARRTGHRAGALHQLDSKIRRIREGEFEARGVPRDAIILPVIVSFDNLGEIGILYEWIEANCTSLGILSARTRVRPLTILTPEMFEAVLAVGNATQGVVELLMRKTSPTERLGKMDRFLSKLNLSAAQWRLPSIEKRFRELTERVQVRMASLLGKGHAQTSPTAGP